MSIPTNRMLSAASYISLATFRKDGRRVATPIWAAPLAEDEAQLVMFSAPNAGKVKRLRNSSTAEVALCDVGGKLLSEWVTARAFLVEPGHDVAAAERAVRRKYGWQSMLLDLTSRIGGRLNKRQYVRIELAAPDAKT